jgi:hypothetical protein
LEHRLNCISGKINLFLIVAIFGRRDADLNII